MGARKLHGRTVVVVGGCRTPFLRSGTGYTDLMAYELGAMAVSGLLQRCRVDPSAVDPTPVEAASDTSYAETARRAPAE